MKRTLFSVLLVAAGVALYGSLETGDGLPKPTGEEWAARNDALARARVFRDAPFDASAIDFARNPNSGVIDPTLTSCKYKPDEASGTTPKFDCELPNGDKIKVKYGWTREKPSEVAATRLLHALGFGADRVSWVRTVRCYGCPFQPYHTRALIELVGMQRYFDDRIEFSRYRDFEEVTAERNLEGEAIEAGSERGWGFFELSQIDPSRGGSTQAEVDAMRLMAMFLHHWDNKTSNQRLICLGADKADCAHPLAMIQDAGSDFGPKKVDLGNWRKHRVWFGDPARCLLSMRDLPYNGGTFQDVTISEGGRRLLGDRLKQLSGGQIEALFVDAGFEDVPQWVAAFQGKVTQIVDRPACPSTKKLSS